MQMGYHQSKKWLDALGVKMSGFDLSNILKLCELAGIDPQKINAVHIAGSNGKGSTCAFLESILREQGHRTMLYTSPHLLEPTERIKVNGGDISQKKFAQLTGFFRQIMEKNNLQPSQFEVLTAMAYRHAIDERIEILVAETGLGGRLDATNVLSPKVCAITSISLEHTEYLGETIGQIAFEKAGIIKQGSVVVVAKSNAGMEAISQEALRKNAKMVVCHWEVVSSTDKGNEFNLILPQGLRGIKMKMIGAYQCENAAVAAAACIALREKGIDVSDSSIRNGILRSFWAGRLDVVKKNPLLVFDAAHNPQGWETLRGSLLLFKYKKLIAVFGAMRDKDIAAAKGLLGEADELILTKFDSARAADPEEILGIIGKGDIFIPVEKALAQAQSRAGKDGLVLVCGSIYLLGDAYRAIGKKKSTSNVNGRVNFH